MIVSFVGGPLHGKHENWESTPGRYIVEVDSEIFRYEWRCSQGGAVGFNPIVYSNATYALVDLPEDEYQRLLKEVESEPSD